MWSGLYLPSLQHEENVGGAAFATELLLQMPEGVLQVPWKDQGCEEGHTSRFRCSLVCTSASLRFQFSACKSKRRS